MTDEINSFPVTGWEIRTVPAYEIILLNLSFLSSPMQNFDKPNPGRNYALTLPQVAELRDALDRSLRKAQSGETPTVSGPMN